MDPKNEILYDFGINMPRVTASGKMAMADNVKRIVFLGENEIILHNGSRYVTLRGRKLTILDFDEERMLVQGEVEEILFSQTI